jgi:hypothetical protein
MRRLLSAAALLAAAMPALAQEALLIGRVERITLLPSGTPACASPCPPAVTRADGSTTVCVSNAGGCQQTAFQVERVLLGPDAVGSKDFSSRIGEWGRQDFPVVQDPILVHVDDGRVHWSRLGERQGVLVFDAAPLARDVIDGVAVSSLQPDADGQLPLEQLLARLPARP